MCFRGDTLGELNSNINARKSSLNMFPVNRGTLSITTQFANSLSLLRNGNTRTFAHSSVITFGLNDMKADQMIYRSIQAR